MNPITRQEQYLAAAAGEYSGSLPRPITREEMYLAKIAEGGGGTSDYTDLENKPQINGVELSGNKTAAQLNVAGLDESGKVPMSILPPAAIERLVVVADDAARFALTTDTVQLGDTVKVTSTTANQGTAYMLRAKLRKQWQTRMATTSRTLTSRPQISTLISPQPLRTLCRTRS